MGRKKNKNKQNDTKDFENCQQNQIAEELATISEASLTQQITIKQQKETIENGMSTQEENVNNLREKSITSEKIIQCHQGIANINVSEVQRVKETNNNCNEIASLANLLLSCIKDSFHTNYAIVEENLVSINNYSKRLSHKGSANHGARPKHSPMFNECICYEAAGRLCNSLTRQKGANEDKRCSKFAQQEIDNYAEIILQAWKTGVKV